VRVSESNSRSSQLGKAPKQGKRKDLDELVEMAKTRKSRKSMIEANPSGVVRYFKGLEYVRSQYAARRDFQTEVIVYWGPTGSGKTYHVKELLGDEEAFFLTKAMVTSNQVWWDGYEDQETIVLEEFYGWIPINVMLSLINTTPFTVQVKGGSRSLMPRRVFITANEPPGKWYKEQAPSVAAAFKRRFMAPIGHVFFLGYGENKDEDYCKCTLAERSTCFREHREVCEPSSSCFATGFRSSSSWSK